MSASRRKSKSAPQAGEVITDPRSSYASWVHVKINYKGEREPEIHLAFDEEGIIGGDVLDEAVEAINSALEELSS